MLSCCCGMSNGGIQWRSRVMTVILIQELFNELQRQRFSRAATIEGRIEFACNQLNLQLRVHRKPCTSCFKIESSWSESLTSLLCASFVALSRSLLVRGVCNGTQKFSWPGFLAENLNEQQKSSVEEVKWFFFVFLFSALSRIRPVSLRAQIFSFHWKVTVQNFANCLRESFLCFQPFLSALSAVEKFMVSSVSSIVRRNWMSFCCEAPEKSEDWRRNSRQSINVTSSDLRNLISYWTSSGLEARGNKALLQFQRTLFNRKSQNTRIISVLCSNLYNFYYLFDRFNKPPNDSIETFTACSHYIQSHLIFHMKYSWMES